MLTSVRSRVGTPATLARSGEWWMSAVLVERGPLDVRGDCDCEPALLMDAESLPSLLAEPMPCMARFTMLPGSAEVSRSTSPADAPRALAPRKALPVGAMGL